MLPATTSGSSASPVHRVVIRIGDSRSLAPRRTSSETERLAFHLLEMAIVLDQQDAVPRGDAEHRDDADERAEREDAVAREGRQHAADERRRKREEDQAASRQLRERRVEDQEDRERHGDRRDEQILLRGLALLVFAEQVRVVADRELDLLEPRPRRRRPPSRDRAL